MLWARQLVAMAKKKNCKLTMKGFRPIAMLPTMYHLYSKILQQLAGQAIPPDAAHSMPHGGTSNEVADTYYRDGLRRRSSF